jgi:cobalt/nickel transport system permease protein
MIHRFSILLRPEALHIPDGFLSVPVSIVGWILAVIIIGFTLRQTREHLGERQIPVVGVLAAFIFAAQAINFPVAGGTSGHMLGGALAAIVLGPWSAVLVMTAVIGLQALLFQDGGLLVMGWNIVNMGVLTILTGSLVYRLLNNWFGRNRTSLIVGSAVGAWLSVQIAAVATAVELAASGTTPLNIGLPAMICVHALIGLGEAGITVGALLLIYRTRPDLLKIGESAPGHSSARWAGVGLALAVVIAVFSAAASASPDGLERVAEDQGFLGTALDPIYNIFPDYTLPFISNGTLSGILAVVLGTAIVFGVLYLFGRVIRRRPATSE